MTICETRIVDVIGVEKDSGKVVLTVSDHLEWDHEHLALLQEKLNVYVAFIESGELTGTYPDAAERQPVIDVVCRYEPSGEAEELFSKVAYALKGAGIEFRYRVLANSDTSNPS